MTPERWRQIEELYHSALERGRAVLANADPDLREQVERMLAEDSGSKILDRPVAELWDESSISEVNLAGRAVSYYEVVEKIGEGGMGVVWKARDTRLDRLVALKFLASRSARQADRLTRFVQEARAASALNHPNIITIYEVGSFEGAEFIAMEFVRGKNLDQLIGNKGLRLSEALKYA